MASAKSHCLVLVASLVLFLIIDPSSSQGTDQLIEKICRQTEDFGSCSKTFKANLKSPNADIHDLTQITIERATDTATTTLSFIRQQLPKTTDPTLKAPLAQCETFYIVITQAFDTAAVSFFSKDYATVVKKETVTPKAEGSCERAFPGLQNLLTDQNRQMRILIAMSLVSVQELIRAKI